jgi:hypothetical protein
MKNGPRLSLEMVQKPKVTIRNQRHRIRPLALVARALHDVNNTCRAHFTSILNDKSSRNHSGRSGRFGVLTSQVVANPWNLMSANQTGKYHHSSRLANSRRFATCRTLFSDAVCRGQRAPGSVVPVLLSPGFSSLYDGLEVILQDSRYRCRVCSADCRTDGIVFAGVMVGLPGEISIS